MKVDPIPALDEVTFAGLDGSQIVDVTGVTQTTPEGKAWAELTVAGIMENTDMMDSATNVTKRAVFILSCT